MLLVEALNQSHYFLRHSPASVVEHLGRRRHAQEYLVERLRILQRDLS